MSETLFGRTPAEIETIIKEWRELRALLNGATSVVKEDGSVVGYRRIQQILNSGMLGLQLNIIVQGTPSIVQISGQAKVHELIDMALKQAGMSHYALYDWELRNKDGHLLHERAIVHSVFHDGETLHLNLRPGIGG